ncbi:hypothetical protein MFLO_10758 [Listeria floridensis FSL S10-1187]|uniref:Cyclic nucleotide-binding domain-containing protein n=1 Tax=Listeria floridensis FSL S10-1187 TaxID=1265817 RepID=A0ABP3AYF7_9LIST|nr:hypothetical protein [Listeria floridensis]EUJ30297.1 hypothetical protein MFLO_10758 [Listeria floridensis FSL S10-1187]
MKKKIFYFADFPAFQEHVRVLQVNPGETVWINENFFLVDSGILHSFSEQFGHTFYIEDDILCQENIKFKAMTHTIIWEVERDFLKILETENNKIRTLLLEGLCKETRWADHLKRNDDIKWKIYAAILDNLALQELPWKYMFDIKLADLDISASEGELEQACNNLSRRKILRFNCHKTNLRINPTLLISHIRNEIEQFSYV